MKTLKTLTLSGLLALGFLSAGALASFNIEPSSNRDVTVIYKTPSSAAI